MNRDTKLTKKRGRAKLPQEKKHAPLVVIMPPADIELLTEEAERRGVSRSELVRRMLDAGMKGIREGKE